MQVVKDRNEAADPPFASSSCAAGKVPFSLAQNSPESHPSPSGIAGAVRILSYSRPL